MQETKDIVDIRCVGETPKAIRVIHPGNYNKGWWVPKSVISKDSEVTGVGHEGTLTVAAWFAEKEGLE